MENKPKFRVGDIITFNHAGRQYLKKLSESRRGATHNYLPDLTGVIKMIRNDLATFTEPIVYEIEWTGNGWLELWTENYLQLGRNVMQRIRSKIVT